MFILFQSYKSLKNFFPKIKKNIFFSCLSFFIFNKKRFQRKMVFKYLYLIINPFTKRNSMRFLKVRKDQRKKKLFSSII